MPCTLSQVEGYQLASGNRQKGPGSEARRRIDDDRATIDNQHRYMQELDIMYFEVKAWN